MWANNDREKEEAPTGCTGASVDGRDLAGCYSFERVSLALLLTQM